MAGHGLGVNAQILHDVRQPAAQGDDADGNGDQVITRIMIAGEIQTEIGGEIADPGIKETVNPGIEEGDTPPLGSEASGTIPDTVAAAPARAPADQLSGEGTTLRGGALQG